MPDALDGLSSRTISALEHLVIHGARQLQRPNAAGLAMYGALHRRGLITMHEGGSMSLTDPGAFTTSGQWTVEATDAGRALFPETKEKLT